MSPNLLIWIYIKKINQNTKVWLSAYFKGNCLSSALNAIYLSLGVITKKINLDLISSLLLKHLMLTYHILHDHNHIFHLVHKTDDRYRKGFEIHQPI